MSAPERSVFVEGEVEQLRRENTELTRMLTAVLVVGGAVVVPDQVRREVAAGKWGWRGISAPDPLSRRAEVHLEAALNTAELDAEVSLNNEPEYVQRVWIDNFRDEQGLAVRGTPANLLLHPDGSVTWEERS